MKRTRRLARLSVLVLAAAALASVPCAAEERDSVTLANDAICLVVNNSDDGQGRFAVDVTGGDPQRSSDDGQPLIYGRPIPWTSYTTVSLDGVVYAFGGPTTRRAGRNLPVGTMVSPPTVKNGVISTTCRFGEVEVAQQLSIVEGPTTGRQDTARIAYTIVNRGASAHRVGLRVCLDTMLGSNDGAPFRLGAKSILTDEVVQQTESQPYWQAFDSLQDPHVIAQGTLAGGELTAPDRLYFTNWGTLADSAWEPQLVPGRDFTRLGEFELDSAAALLWDEVDLQPGKVMTRVTYYGLGGITVAQGVLTLGLTAPASAESGGDAFLVLGYLENRGDGVAQDVSVTLSLPSSLQALSPQRVELGRVKQGESRQVAWMVKPVGAGEATITLKAEGFHLEPTVVQRKINLVAPARLSLEVEDPPQVKVSNGYYLPYPETIHASLANVGASSSANAWLELAPGAGVSFAPGESGLRLVGPLKPGEKVDVQWAVVPGGAAGKAGLTVLAGSRDCPSTQVQKEVLWPALPKQIKVVVAPVQGHQDWVRIDLSLINLSEASRVTLRIPLGDLRLLTAERGGFFVDQGRTLSWLTKPAAQGGYLVLDAKRSGTGGGQDESFATLWLARGESTPLRMLPEIIQLLDSAGRPIPAIIVYEYEGGIEP